LRFTYRLWGGLRCRCRRRNAASVEGSRAVREQLRRRRGRRCPSDGAAAEQGCVAGRRLGGVTVCDVSRRCRGRNRCPAKRRSCGERPAWRRVQLRRRSAGSGGPRGRPRAATGSAFVWWRQLREWGGGGRNGCSRRGLLSSGVVAVCLASAAAATGGV
jgi:hypothetical protein